MRIGLGHDTHRLGEGGPLRIGGVEIPFDKHLVGHSDADVLLHAVTDALLGAAALGDIGELFPNTEQENKDRDLDRIFEDLQGVRVQLEEWLAEFSDHDLTDPKRYSWSKGLPLWHIIAENSFRHEAEHLPQINAFAARWAAEG